MQKSAGSLGWRSGRCLSHVVAQGLLFYLARSTSYVFNVDCCKEFVVPFHSCIPYSCSSSINVGYSLWNIMVAYVERSSTFSTSLLFLIASLPSMRRHYLRLQLSKSEHFQLELQEQNSAICDGRSICSFRERVCRWCIYFFDTQYAVMLHKGTRHHPLLTLIHFPIIKFRCLRYLSNFFSQNLAHFNSRWTMKWCKMRQ